MSADSWEQLELLNLFLHENFLMPKIPNYYISLSSIASKHATMTREDTWIFLNQSAASYVTSAFAMSNLTEENSVGKSQAKTWKTNYPF